MTTPKSAGFSVPIPESAIVIGSNDPACSNPPTSTNKPTKKRRTLQSTRLRALQ
jgi:hypothetical protein